MAVYMCVCASTRCLCKHVSAFVSVPADHNLLIIQTLLPSPALTHSPQLSVALSHSGSSLTSSPVILPCQLLLSTLVLSVVPLVHVSAFLFEQSQAFLLSFFEHLGLLGFQILPSLI